MQSNIRLNTGVQAVVLGTVVLLTACQSSNMAPGPGGASPMTASHTEANRQNSVYRPSPENTARPSYIGISPRPGSFSPQVGHDYLFMADQSRNEIDIFPREGRNRAQVGSITSGIDAPYGLWFDRPTKSLYVANQNNNTVTVYPNGSIMPSVTYMQGLSRPLYAIVDRNGEVYVGNANNGTVVEYLAGSTTVHQVLQSPGNEVDGLSFDKHENLYVAYRSGQFGSVEVFAPGSTQGHVLGMTLDQPQGVVVDIHGNVVATETGSTDRVDLFPPGSTTASLELPMPGGSVATQLAIDCREKFLYVSGLYSGIVFGVDYPLAGQSLFVKDQVSAVIQGASITDNINF